MKTKSIVRCIHCNSDYDIWIDLEDLAKWSDGELIQDVLHYLTPSERELLISGTCDICWHKMFPSDDQE